MNHLLTYLMVGVVLAPSFARIACMDDPGPVSTGELVLFAVCWPILALILFFDSVVERANP